MLVPKKEDDHRRCLESPIALHLITLPYNIATIATYFKSVDDFPEHMGWLSESMSHRFSAHAVPLIAVMCCDGILFLSNQLSFPKRLHGLFFKEAQQGSLLSSCEKIAIGTVSGMSATFKMAVATSSLLALLTNTLGFWPGVAISALCSAGNLFSQCSVLLEPFGIKIKCFDKVMSHSSFSWFCSAGYTLTNTALYFNTFDNAGKNLGITKDRLIEFASTVETVLASINIGSSTLFTIETFRVFQQRLKTLFKASNDHPECEALLESTERKRKLNSPSALGWYSSVYKTITTMLALLSISVVLTRETDIDFSSLLKAGIIILGLMMSGCNFACQASEYTTQREKKEEPSFSCCRV